MRDLNSKEFNCIQFVADSEKVIGEMGGKKESFDIRNNAYISGGLNIGEVVINAISIEPEKTDRRIMMALEENDKKRMTEYALERKRNIVREDDKHQLSM